MQYRERPIAINLILTICHFFPNKRVGTIFYLTLWVIIEINHPTMENDQFKLPENAQRELKPGEE